MTDELMKDERCPALDYMLGEKDQNDGTVLRVGDIRAARRLLDDE